MSVVSVKEVYIHVFYYVSFQCFCQKNMWVIYLTSIDFDLAIYYFCFGQWVLGRSDQCYVRAMILKSLAYLHSPLLLFLYPSWKDSTLGSVDYKNNNNKIMTIIKHEKKAWTKLVAWSRATQAKPQTFEPESKCLCQWDTERWGRSMLCNIITGVTWLIRGVTRRILLWAGYKLDPSRLNERILVAPAWA